jgi:hypothetical protein
LHFEENFGTRFSNSSFVEEVMGFDWIGETDELLRLQAGTWIAEDQQGLGDGLTAGTRRMAEEVIELCWPLMMMWRTPQRQIQPWPWPARALLLLRTEKCAGYASWFVLLSPIFS